jgi:Apea-like HEPN
MQSYFFPCLGIDPKFDEPLWESGNISVRRRLFPTSTFDLATLASRHTLHVPYQLMDVYLADCHLEFEIRGARDFQQAADQVQVVRMLFYLQGLAPFLVPFCTTFSVNDYSGINARDSEALRKRLSPEMQNGLTSESGTLEAWAVDLSILLLRTSGQPQEMTSRMCEKVASDFVLWTRLEEKHPVLTLVRKMTNNAPMIPDQGSSILHMWQALESLFPNVSTEVSFRLSLLISQLCAGLETPSGMYRTAKAAYNVRSKIAHGADPNKMTASDWFRAWWVLRTCLSAIIQREQLPTDEKLFEELLDDS